MAATILGGMAHAAIGIPGHIVSSLGGLFTASIEAGLELRKLASHQRAFYLDPMVLPDAGTIFDLWNRKFIDDDLANGALRNHGISTWPVGKGEYYQDSATLWRAVKRAGLTRPSPDAWADLYRRGRIDKEQFKASLLTLGSAWTAFEGIAEDGREEPGVEFALDLFLRGLIDRDKAKEMLGRAGVDGDKWLETIELRRERPGTGDVIDAYVRGRIDEDTFLRLLTEAGTDLALWHKLLPARYGLPSIGEIQVARNRDVITEEEYLSFLDRHGIRDKDSRVLIDALRSELPPIGDLINFELKEAFLPEIANALHLYDEFPGNAVRWTEAQGLRGGPGFKIIQDGELVDASWLALYWASHWQPLAPGQVYDAQFRMRPGRAQRFRNAGYDVRDWTVQDTRRWLRYGNFAPGIRDTVAALASRPLGMRQIQQAYKLGVILPQEAEDRFEDLGYLKEDAKIFIGIADAQKAAQDEGVVRAVEKRLIGKTISEIENLYRDGVLDRDRAQFQLDQTGLNTETVAQLLDLTDLGVVRSIVRSGVQATRRDFLDGTLSAVEATTTLQRIGVANARVGQYISLWTIQRDRRRKTLARADVIKYVASAEIGEEEARQRLANLGYAEPDLHLLLAEASGKLAERQAKARKTSELDRRRRTNELRRLAKEAKAQAKSLEAAAAKQAPRSVLAKWLKDGILNKRQFYSRMAELGYQEKNIDAYYRDATKPKPPSKQKGKTASEPATDQTPPGPQPATGP